MDLDTSTDADVCCAGTPEDNCITYPHRYNSHDGRLSDSCRNGHCDNMGIGDPCGDGDCLWHPDHPDNPYNCPEWVERDWCDHIEHQRAVCPDFAEDGSCIHSAHMQAAGL